MNFAKANVADKRLESAQACRGVETSRKPFVSRLLIASRLQSETKISKYASVVRSLLFTSIKWKISEAAILAFTTSGIKLLIWPTDWPQKAIAKKTLKKRSKCACCPSAHASPIDGDRLHRAIVDEEAAEVEGKRVPVNERLFRL